MPIFDAHAYYGTPPGSACPWSPQHYLQTMERFQIERVVLSSWFAEACDFVRGNAELDQALSQQERWRGYVVVNGHYPDESVEELAKYLGKGRFLGARLNPALHRQPLTEPASLEILSACRRYGQPVLVHTSTVQEVRQVCEVAREYTTLRFIMSEMSPEAWELAVRLAEPHIQIYFGVSSLYALHNQIAEAVERMGPRRLLFTSGAGLTSVPCVAGMMRDAGLSRGDQERIGYRNALEVFSLQEQGLPEWVEE